MSFVQIVDDLFVYDEICKFCPNKILGNRHTCYRAEFSIHMYNTYILLNKYHGIIREYQKKEAFVIKTNYISYRQCIPVHTTNLVYTNLFDTINHSPTLPELFNNLKILTLFS